ILCNLFNIDIQEVEIPETVIYSIQNITEKNVYQKFDAALCEIMMFPLCCLKTQLLISGKVEN
ncbi:hypothetical protein EI555_000566, partial [Monodon monoceros]